MVKKIQTSCLYYLAIVAIADLTGVLAVTVFDILFTRFDSGALYYAIWFVIGVFAGFIYTGVCNHNDSEKNNMADSLVAILVALLLSALLIVVCYITGEMASQVPAYDYYIPGHKYITYTFFISFLAATFLSHYINTGKKTTS